jgi:hypothetical protein
MQVTLLSDGTGTYANFEMLNSSLQLDGIDYNTAGELWNSRLDQMVNAVKNGTEGELYSDTENIAPFQYLAFYLTTLPNVEMWVQHPDYLVNADDTVMQAKSSMKLVAKDPAKMYRDLDRTAFYEYQKAVLANALVGSTTLDSLEDAVAYFNGTLDRSDKEVVLILGTNRQTLDENKSYIDQTVNFHTTDQQSLLHDFAIPGYPAANITGIFQTGNIHKTGRLCRAEASEIFLPFHNNLIMVCGIDLQIIDSHICLIFREEILPGIGKVCLL